MTIEYVNVAQQVVDLQGELDRVWQTVTIMTTRIERLELARGRVNTLLERLDFLRNDMAVFVKLGDPAQHMISLHDAAQGWSEELTEVMNDLGRELGR